MMKLHQNWALRSTAAGRRGGQKAESAIVMSLRLLRLRIAMARTASAQCGGQASTLPAHGQGMARCYFSSLDVHLTFMIAVSFRYTDLSAAAAAAAVYYGGGAYSAPYVVWVHHPVWQLSIFLQLLPAFVHQVQLLELQQQQQQQQ
jgi:hypothetical protein